MYSISKLNIVYPPLSQQMAVFAYALSHLTLPFNNIFSVDVLMMLGFWGESYEADLLTQVSGSNTHTQKYICLLGTVSLKAHHARLLTFHRVA